MNDFWVLQTDVARFGSGLRAKIDRETVIPLRSPRGARGVRKASAVLTRAEKWIFDNPIIFGEPKI